MKKLIIVGLFLFLFGLTACSTVQAATNNSTLESSLENRIAKLEASISKLEEVVNGSPYSAYSKSLEDRISALEKGTGAGSYYNPSLNRYR